MVRKKIIRLNLSSSSQQIQLPAIGGVTKVNLVNYSIYNTSYTINANNNTISVVSSGATYTTALPNGFYTASNLAAQLQNTLTNSINKVTWTVSYSSSTGLFTITSSSTVTINFASYPWLPVSSAFLPKI
jgi:hypothetical protein